MSGEGNIPWFYLMQKKDLPELEGRDINHDIKLVNLLQLFDVYYTSFASLFGVKLLER